MKKVILTTILAFTASLAYAGSGCCSAGGDKDKTNDAGKTNLTETSAIVAKSCGGGSCGDKESKTGLSDSSANLVAKSCGGGSCGDKESKTGHSEASTDLVAKSCGGGSCGDKESKTGLQEAGAVVAGDCGSSCGDKGSKSKLSISESLVAGSCGGSCGDKSKGKSGFSVSAPFAA